MKSRRKKIKRINAPPVTLTTNGSILPVPDNCNHTFVSKSCYNHLAALPLFQKVVMVTLLRLPVAMTTYFYDYLITTILSLYQQVIMALCLYSIPVTLPI